MPDIPPNTGTESKPESTAELTAELRLAIEAVSVARKAAEDAAHLADTAAKQATRAAEATEIATTDPGEKETEAKIQRAAKKASVAGITVGGCLTVIMLSIVYFKRAIGLEFKPDIWTEIGATLGGLLIVALIVERIVEILVSIWSSSKSDALLQQRDFHEKLRAKREKQIVDLRRESGENPPPNADRQKEILDALITKRRQAAQAESEIEEAERQLVPHGARTRRLAAWSGLAIGVLASSVGFRLLQNLVTIDPLRTGINPQYGAFLAVDVLLTGAVLAGGSVFIHQIFAVYDNFMNATKQRARSLSQEKVDQ
jgi:hypothetical protein